jgi:DNA-binding NarL/FixJ family response regulator
VPKKRSAVIYSPQPLWLEAVEGVLAHGGVTVIGKATTHDHCLALVAERQPSLLLGDAGTETHSDDLELVRRCHAVTDELKVILLASRTDPDSIDDALRSGVSAYVFKTAHPEDVAAAIRQAFEHSVYIGPPASATRSPAVKAHRYDEPDPRLTRREREILSLVAQGHSNARMAKMLWVTEQTVKFHLSNIYRKLGVANRTEASRWAHAHGLVSMAARANDVSRRG